jgi:hypothetical protein
VPQFALSEVRFTQTPSQIAGTFAAPPYGTDQFAPQAHCPWTHVSPTKHLFPHAPQLETSTPTSVQAPLQSEPPSTHAQCPAVHVESAGHALPHAPQFAPSWSRPEVQQLPSGDNSPPELHAHVPEMQDCGDGQRSPQPPQFRGSEFRSLHPS